MTNRRIIDQTEAISLSSDDYLVADNVNLGTRKIQFTRLLSGATPLPPNYTTGLGFDKNDAQEIIITAGYGRSADNLRNIILNTSLIKDITSTFDLGNNAGCMPSGLTLQASTLYYVFVISNSGGQTDVIIDTDENCANGLADNTVVLNNFDKFVCVGSFETAPDSIIVRQTCRSLDFLTVNQLRNLYNKIAVEQGRANISRRRLYRDVGITYNYTAEIDGLLVYTIGALYNWHVYINGVEYNWMQRYDGDSATNITLYIPVLKGDVLTATYSSGGCLMCKMYYNY